MLPFLRKSRIRPRYLRAPPLSRQTATLSSKSDCFSRRKLNLNRQQVLQNMARPSTMSVYREKEKQWSFYPRSVSYFSTLTGDDENDTENLKSSNNNNNNRASSLSPKEEILLSLCQDIPNAVEEIISSVEEEEELQRQRQLQEEDNDEENIHTLKSRFGRDKESLRTRFDRSWDAHRREKLISQQQSTTNSDPWVIGDEKDLDFLTMFESQGWDNLASEENVANISAGDDKEESPSEEQHDDSKQVNIGVMENASEETLSSSNTDFDVISGNKADGVDVVLVDSTHHAVDENECLSDALAATSPVITKDETDITSSNDTDGIIQEQGELDTMNRSKGAHMEDTLQEETDKSLLLLKNMSATDWRLFDSDGGSEEFSKDAFDFEKMNLEELNDTKGLQDRFPLDGNREHQLVVAEEEEAETPNQLELVQDLLEEARNGTIELSTKEYNLLLSRMATAIDLSVEDVMDTLLRIYHQMKKLAMPDETTYEILVFALDRRVSGGSGSSNRTIRDLLKDMVHFKVQLSSNLLLKQGIRCCDQDNDVKLAKRLIVDYALGDENRTYKVSTRVIRSLMKMFARENMQKDAINLLEKCLKEHGGRDPRGIDSIFDVAIRWPDKNRAGKRRDITKVLENILDVMENGKHRPGYSAWRNLIVALSRTTDTDPNRWKLLQRPFRTLFDQYKYFYPDEFLLRIGLKYCEATIDSKLARDLIMRLSERHMKNEMNTEKQTSFADGSFSMNDASWEYPGLFSTNDEGLNNMQFQSSAELDESDTLFDAKAEFSEFSDSFDTLDADQREPIEGDLGGEQTLGVQTVESTDKKIEPYTPAPFSFKIFQQAIKIGLAAGDVSACKDILDILKGVEHLFPKDIQSEIWTFSLKGLAMISRNPDILTDTFDHMRRHEMKLSEETYGAMIHGLAVAKRPDEAIELLEGMESDSFGDGIKPGLSCYNAIMISHINEKSWREVIDVYDRMIKENVKPNSATTQGLLIAAYRIGGRERVQEMVGDLLANDVVISQENCQLAMKIMVPDVIKGTESKITEIQNHLRDLGTKNELLKSASFNLLRSIRQAEIEQNRKPSKQVPLDDILRRREEAWEGALKDVLELAQTQNKLKSGTG